MRNISYCQPPLKQKRTSKAQSLTSPIDRPDRAVTLQLQPAATVISITHQYHFVKHYFAIMKFILHMRLPFICQISVLRQTFYTPHHDLVRCGPIQLMQLVLTQPHGALMLLQDEARIRILIPLQEIHNDLHYDVLFLCTRLSHHQSYGNKCTITN